MNLNQFWNYDYSTISKSFYTNFTICCIKFTINEVLYISFTQKGWTCHAWLVSSLMYSTTKITTVIGPEGIPCYYQPQDFKSWTFIYIVVNVHVHGSMKFLMDIHSIKVCHAVWYKHIYVNNIDQECIIIENYNFDSFVCRQTCQGNTNNLIEPEAGCVPVEWLSRIFLVHFKRSKLCSQLTS